MSKQVMLSITASAMAMSTFVLLSAACAPGKVSLDDAMQDMRWLMQSDSCPRRGSGPLLPILQ